MEAYIILGPLLPKYGTLVVNMRVGPNRPSWTWSVCNNYEEGGWISLANLFFMNVKAIPGMWRSKILALMNVKAIISLHRVLRHQQLLKLQISWPCPWDLLKIPWMKTNYSTLPNLTFWTQQHHKKSLSKIILIKIKAHTPRSQFCKIPPYSLK